MLAADRQRRIVEMLAERSSVLAADVRRELGVSAVTVRSDFDVLERRGELKRTRGGAVSVSQLVVPHVTERMRKNVRAKQAIARYAAQLVDDGETILVGSGSTPLEFVHALGRQRLTSSSWSTIRAGSWPKLPRPLTTAFKLWRPGCRSLCCAS